MEGTSFLLRIPKEGNNNTKRLAYTALVRPILEYGAVCWDHTEKALNRVQKNTAKSANNKNESGWGTSAQRRLIVRMCALFKAYTGRRAWKAVRDGLLKPCYLSRDEHNRKIRARNKGEMLVNIPS